MKYESSILKRLIDVYGVVGNPRYISEIIKQFIVQGKECYPNLFTYQSDWLAHIDEFGLTPEYTVSYTGQQIYAPHTKERPVKRAILKGQTLVNLVNQENQIYSLTADGTYKTIHIPLRYDITDTTKKFFLSCRVITNTIEPQYTNFGLFATDRSNNCGINMKIGGGKIGKQITVKTLGKTANYLRLYIASDVPSGTLAVTDIMLIEYQDGMENWDIPYFEGMQSVKMPVLKATGKNLFNLNEAYDDSEDNGISFSYKNTGVVLNGSRTDKTLTSTSRMLNINHLLKPGKTYSISSNYEGKIVCSFRLTKKDGSLDYKKTFEMNNQYSKADVYIQLTKNTTIDNFVNSEILIQFEESSSITPYEPFKSNILTVNEDVTLRGIGDVEDTLDCLTGEVTERIGEVLLDGSEEWSINNSNNEGFFSCSTTTYVGVPNGKVISDKLPSVTSTKTEGVMMGVTTGKLLVSFNRDKTGVTSLAKFKEKLAQLQLKVCYEIENVEKTVGLTIHDKDQQKVERLASFEGGTHFTTTSQEGSLLPTLTVDVVTDLEETLNLCSTDGNTL